MANMQKYTRNALGHMLKHYARAKDQDGEYVKFGNQNIDQYLTQYNYTFTSRKDDLDNYEFIKKRTEELKALKRKDVNVMATWVVTIPQQYLNKAKQDPDEFLRDTEDTYSYKFFKETYKFLENKYGKDNVVGGFIHVDETTPHMHFAFIPTVRDNKKQRLKVSAKECLNKKALQKFHPELNAYLNKALKKELKELGLEDIGVITNNNRDKQYIPMEDLKKRIKELEIANKRLQKQQTEQIKAMQSLKFKNGKNAWDYCQERMAKSQQNRTKQQTKNRQDMER